MRCYEPDELERFATGESEGVARDAIETHLAACGPCRGLLQEVTENLAAAAPVRAVMREARDATTDPPSPPSAIGPFRVVRELGRGGMGVVYLAEQDRPRRHVALKVLRPGLLSAEYLRRFEYEANVLAQLRHPGIACIHETGIAEIMAGGTVERVPYFAMEYVEGERLDRWAERRPELRERLDLLARICDAVHHAHLKGIVHRDLKPGNILVENGQPRILDFGVARAAESDALGATMHTEADRLVGTIPFMSPEQFETTASAPDARSDVYALGVLGFWLATGSLPRSVAGVPLAEVARRAREDPPLAGRLDRRLRGDVETILARALAPDRERRYQSASELAADLRRHLCDEPIQARPPTASYQLLKLVRRHKAIAIAAGALLALTVGYAVTVSILFDRAADARRAAATEALTANQVAEFLAALFEEADPRNARGEAVTVREVLDRGAERVRAELAEQPDVQARMLHAIGGVYKSLGLYEESARLLEEELAILGRIHGENHPQVASALNTLGLLSSYRGDYARAETLQRRALDMRRGLFGADHATTAVSMVDLASTRFRQGGHAEAESLLEGALDIERRTLAADDPTLASTMNNLASVYRVRGRYEEAEALYRESLGTSRAALGEDHPDVISTLSNLAGTRNALGDHAEAAALYREALALRRKVLGENHPHVAEAINNLAVTLLRQGDAGGAEPLQREAVALRRRLLGPAHPDVAKDLNNLAGVLIELKRLDEADSCCREALGIVRGSVGERHDLYAAVLSNLGEIATARGDHASAEALHRQALGIRREALGAGHPSVAASLHFLGRCRQQQGDPAGAEPLLREALAIRQEALPAGNRLIKETAASLGACLAALGKPAEGASLPLEAAHLTSRLQERSNGSSSRRERSSNGP